MPDATFQYHVNTPLILWFVGCFFGSALHELLKQPEGVVTFWRHLLPCHGQLEVCSLLLSFDGMSFCLQAVHTFARATGSLCGTESGVWRQFSACATERQWWPGLGLLGIAERSRYCALCNHTLLGECMPVLINDVTVKLC